MYCTVIRDEDLLPVGHQVQMLDEAPSSPNLADKCKSLQSLLKRELERSEISMLEYISLSQKVIGKLHS